MAGPFERFEADFHAHRLEDRGRAYALGFSQYGGSLPDRSPEAGEEMVRQARALLAQARSLDREALTADQETDVRLAERMLERACHDHLHARAGLPAHARVSSAGDDLADGIFMLLVNDPRPAAARFDDIVQRLEGVPAYLRGLRARVRAPVERWRQVELDKLSGVGELYETARRFGESELPERSLERFERARQAALDAIDIYRKHFRALPGTKAIHVGRQTAERIVQLRGIELSLDALHRMSRRFLRRTRERLEELRGPLAERYAGNPKASLLEVQDALAEHFAVPLGDRGMDAVLDAYGEERARILDFIGERDLFPLPDDEELRILKTPTFLEPTIPAGAMVPPPPFREGRRTSLVYLTLRPELLAEHTRLGIPGMMIHEGIPGHHLQLTWAGLHPSVIRRHEEAMDQAEGWTTRLEDYMLDLGYMGELTDACRFVTKMDLARLGARVAIDLFFMTGERGFLDVGVPDADPVEGEEPFQAAGRLLSAVTGFTPARVEAELNWYSMEPGYPLSYLVGNQLTHELATDMVGPAGLERDRRFHETFLRAGSMPMADLRRHFRQQGLLLT